MSEVIERFSDNYGLIKYEMIGVVNWSDIYRKKMDYSIFSKWMKKYHYCNFFHAVIFVRQNLTEDSEFDSYKIYVPVDDINNDWNPEHWYSLHLSLKKKKRVKLPVSTSRKKVDEWKKSLSDLLS